jgi:predicted membrane chloride channel (bestrophin family)
MPETVWSKENETMYQRDLWDYIELGVLGFFTLIYIGTWISVYVSMVAPLGKRGNGLFRMIAIHLLLPMTFTISFSVCAFMHFKNNLCGKMENIKGLDTGMQVMGVSLMFILSRKAAFAYNRWWEGRGHIGAVARSLRSIGMLAADAAGSQEKQVKEDYLTVMMLLRIYIPVLRQHARKEIKPGWSISFIQDWKPGAACETTISPAVGAGLSADLKCDIERSLPNPIIMIHSKLSSKVRVLLQAAKMSNACEVTLEEDLARLLGGYHGVDKITRTMMPPLYDLLLIAALWAYVYVLLPYYLPYSYWVGIHIDACEFERAEEKYLYFMILTNVIAVVIFCGMRTLAITMEVLYYTLYSLYTVLTMQSPCRTRSALSASTCPSRTSRRAWIRISTTSPPS